MIRIGLLGAARIAPKAMVQPVSARSDCDIIAVGCRDTKRGRKFVSENGLTARVTSYEEICTASDIDMIYCALPPSAHLEWVRLALENGKAVLCEKPFSMGVMDARLMREAALAFERPLMEAFHYYFHPAFQKVLEIVKSGVHGPVTAFTGFFNVSVAHTPGQLRYDASLGGGGLMDLGCYPLHAFRQLVGEPIIDEVSAKIEEGVDVGLTANMFCGEVIGKIESSMQPEEEQSRGAAFHIDFADASITFSNFVAPHQGFDLDYRAGGVRRPLELENPVTYDCQLAHFINVMGGGPQALTVQDATSQMAAIEEIYKKAGLR